MTFHCIFKALRINVLYLLLFLCCNGLKCIWSIKGWGLISWPEGCCRSCCHRHPCSNRPNISHSLMQALVNNGPPPPPKKVIKQQILFIATTTKWFLLFILCIHIKYIHKIYFKKTNISCVCG